MTAHRINRTYRASEGARAAYPYRGASAARNAGWLWSGIDHGGWTTTLVIGAGSPTGPDKNENVARGRRGHGAGVQKERRSTLHRLAASTNRSHDRVSRQEVCANTPAGSPATETEARAQADRWMGRRMTISINEKDRCANTGLLHGRSFVVLSGI
jgi:hypothetical protein